GTNSTLCSRNTRTAGVTGKFIVQSSRFKVADSRFKVSFDLEPATLNSIPERLARLERVRHALLRLVLTGEREERFAFKVEQVLLGDARRVVEIAARHDARKLFTDERIVI